MKLNALLVRTLGILMLLFIAASCEDDFLEIGDGLVDSSNFTSGVEAYNVVAYNEQLVNKNAVQTNGLNVGILGFYNDPLYGTTTASTLSQVGLTTYNRTYGTNPVIDSIVFTMPYFSTQSVNEESETVYTLDSVSGTSPIKLTAYRSNYLLTDNAPPDFEDATIYYSDDIPGFTGVRGDFLFEKEVLPSNAPVITTVPAEATAENQDPVATTNSPRLRFRLDGLTTGANSAYWQDVIFSKEGQDVLFNGNAFRNYFRGIYLDAQPIGNTGNYFVFDKANTSIVIYYKSGAETARVSGSITLGFSGNSVVNFENNFKTSVTDRLATVNTTEGDANLFLKGGQGSMAVVELFGADTDNDGIPEELAELRAKNRLIREANLEFFVDQSTISALSTSAISEPERIYIYDLETNQPLVDFSLDANITSQGVITAVGTTHLGPLTKTESGAGISYKIRITEYIKNLLSADNDSPNTKLGVVISQNLTAIGTARIDNKTSADYPNRIPFASVVSQKGTVLYGSNSSVPDEKRLKLNIFYSEAGN
ncbi:DUF4270 domain-containing protein [Leeuwenhoekiella sp. MAR_2009_132]|uniref:DUF4270 domain-containing protein n=1 Tax=Leeuwenhoekiella sp. MAR_2009_132 TaxID=1392489 RepID=UPI00055F4869|nr:DUF4270 domain-containing protein [Leeuwenhoekiella sp. MAR_2009_132]